MTDTADRIRRFNDAVTSICEEHAAEEHATCPACGQVTCLYWTDQSGDPQARCAAPKCGAILGVRARSNPYRMGDFRPLRYEVVRGMAHQIWIIATRDDPEGPGDMSVDDVALPVAAEYAADYLAAAYEQANDTTVFHMAREAAKVDGFRFQWGATRPGTDAAYRLATRNLEYLRNFGRYLAQMAIAPGSHERYQDAGFAYVRATLRYDGRELEINTSTDVPPRRAPAGPGPHETDARHYRRDLGGSLAAWEATRARQQDRADEARQRTQEDNYRGALSFIEHSFNHGYPVDSVALDLPDYGEVEWQLLREMWRDGVDQGEYKMTERYLREVFEHAWLFDNENEAVEWGGRANRFIDNPLKGIVTVYAPVRRLRSEADVEQIGIDGFGSRSSAYGPIVYRNLATALEYADRMKQDVLRLLIEEKYLDAPMDFRGARYPAGAQRISAGKAQRVEQRMDDGSWALLFPSKKAIKEGLAIKRANREGGRAVEWEDLEENPPQPGVVEVFGIINRFGDGDRDGIADGQWHYTMSELDVYPSLERVQRQVQSLRHHHGGDYTILRMLVQDRHLLQMWGDYSLLRGKPQRVDELKEDGDWYRLFPPPRRVAKPNPIPEVRTVYVTSRALDDRRRGLLRKGDWRWSIGEAFVYPSVEEARAADPIARNILRLKVHERDLHTNDDPDHVHDANYGMTWLIGKPQRVDEIQPDGTWIRLFPYRRPGVP